MDEWLCWNKLNFSEVNEKYNGEYTCEVEQKEQNNPKSITPKLLVLQRHNIFTSSSQHNLTVIKGSSVVLKCAASGNFETIIVCTKRNRDLAGLDHWLGNAIQIKIKTVTLFKILHCFFSRPSFLSSLSWQTGVLQNYPFLVRGFIDTCFINVLFEICCTICL